MPISPRNWPVIVALGRSVNVISPPAFAISGISLIGSLVLAGAKGYPLPAHILGFVAVTTATVNVVGGFGITDRMLKMFRKNPETKAVAK